MVNMSFSMLALVGYFMLSIFVYINCHLKGEMRLTYGKLGPTEFRLILIIVNTLFCHIPWLSQWKRPLTLFNNDFMVGLYDYLAIVISILLFVFYLIGFFQDAKYFARMDPPKKIEE